jgi:hypothetical protein
MKSFKNLTIMAFVIIMATEAHIDSKSKKSVTFINKLGTQVTLTGPRGSKTLANDASNKIIPKTDPVQYTIRAQGYETYTGTAQGGSTYTINDEDGQITVG